MNLCFVFCIYDFLIYLQGHLFYLFQCAICSIDPEGSRAFLFIKGVNDVMVCQVAEINEH